MIGFLGGTGPEGRGLALRFALAGEPVIIGSRVRDRAEQAAKSIARHAPEGAVRGGLNLEVATQGDIVFVAVPYAGHRATLDSLRDALDGKVVVVSVWGSWCPSCRRQLPILNALQSKYDAQDFQVLTFSLDRSDAVHRQFVKDQNIEVPSIYAREGDGLRVVKMLQHGAGTLEAVPTVLIYDKKGQLAHRLVGFFNHRQLSELVEPLLEER